MWPLWREGQWSSEHADTGRRQVLSEGKMLTEGKRDASLYSPSLVWPRLSLTVITSSVMSNRLDSSLEENIYSGCPKLSLLLARDSWKNCRFLSSVVLIV